MTILQPTSPELGGSPSPDAPRTPPVWVNLLNVAGFYAGWFACVLGLAWGWPLLGPLAAVAIVGLHLALRSDRRAEAVAIVWVVAFGPWIDASLAHLGVASFREPLLLGVLAPPSLFALWAIFATTFDASLGWLGQRPLLAAAFGGVGIVPTYYAAERMGAVDLDPVAWAWIVPTALLWGLGVPLLFRLATWARARAAA